jgi:alpha-L-fucosidase
MRKILCLLCLLMPAVICLGQEITPSTKPNKCQQMLIDRGYGMFIHFGPNTFADTEWSDGTIPPSTYSPTKLDCDQWVRVARDAGFRYVLLVTKHHDGFCLWDSKYTEYDVASSPVKTDVVGAVAKACRKYGLKFAIYYSLWDRNNPSYKDKDPEKYVDYMCDQLTELMTGYGPVCELWLDGGWDREPEDWNIPRVYKHVKQLQPQCAIAVNQTISSEENSRKYALPDSMVADNKYYFSYFPSDFRLWDPKIANKADKKQYLHDGQSYYLPFEHTICLSKAWTWFEKSGDTPVRDLDEMEELFYWCTDNDNTLVVDVPPDMTGRIRENEANAIISLGKRIGIKKGKPLPRNGEFISMNMPAQATSVWDDTGNYGPQMAVDGGMGTRWASADTAATLSIDLDESKQFNKIAIFEYQDRAGGSDGFSNRRVNRIQFYAIDIFRNGEWQTVYADNSPMGDCKVIRFPQPYRASKIRLRILKATAPPSIYEFNVIYK